MINAINLPFIDAKFFSLRVSGYNSLGAGAQGYGMMMTAFGVVQFFGGLLAGKDNLTMWISIRRVHDVL